jgi:hypothetical protein
MDKIEIDVCYCLDESGKKVYDVEEMFAELDRKIFVLQQAKISFENKESDNG